MGLILVTVKIGNHEESATCAHSESVRELASDLARKAQSMADAEYRRGLIHKEAEAIFLSWANRAGSHWAIYQWLNLNPLEKAFWLEIAERINQCESK